MAMGSRYGLGKSRGWDTGDARYWSTVTFLNSGAPGCDGRASSRAVMNGTRTGRQRFQPALRHGAAGRCPACRRSYQVISGVTLTPCTTTETATVVTVTVTSVSAPSATNPWSMAYIR